MANENYLRFFATLFIFSSILVYTRSQSIVNETADAVILFNAVIHDPFDPKPFIEILPKRTCDQRALIALEYGNIYKRFIVEDIREEPSLNNAEKVLITSSFSCYSDFYSYMIRLYFDIETDFRRKLFTDISILAAVDPDMKSWITESFNFLNNHDVGYMTKKHLKGDYRSYMRVIWVNEDYVRNVNETVDPQAATKIAEDLMKEKDDTGWKDKRVQLDKALLTHNLNQTKLILDSFKFKYGKELSDAIKENRKGDLAVAYEWTVQYIRDPVDYTVDRLRESAMDIDNGFLLLIRTILSHREADWDQVTAAYTAKFKEPLTILLETTKDVFHDLIMGYVK